MCQTPLMILHSRVKLMLTGIYFQHLAAWKYTFHTERWLVLLMPPPCETGDAAGTCVWSNAFPGLRCRNCFWLHSGVVRSVVAVAAPVWPVDSLRMAVSIWRKPEQQVCNSAEMCKHFMLLNHITCCVWHTSAAETFLELHFGSRFKKNKFVLRLLSL